MAILADYIVLITRVAMRFPYALRIYTAEYLRYFLQEEALTSIKQRDIPTLRKHMVEELLKTCTESTYNCIRFGRGAGVYGYGC